MKAATAKYFQQVLGRALWIFPGEPLRVPDRAVVGEHVDIEAALQRLHAAVQTAGALVVDDVPFVHLHLVQSVHGNQDSQGPLLPAA